MLTKIAPGFSWYFWRHTLQKAWENCHCQDLISSGFRFSYGSFQPETPVNHQWLCGVKSLPK